MGTNETEVAVRALRRKVAKLEEERDSLLEQFDEKIASLRSSVSLLAEELQEESPDRNAENSFPSDGSLPEMILHVFRTRQRVMEPSEVENIISERVPNLRKNSVAETMSRMYSDNRLHRHKYSGRTNDYGLPNWKKESSNDFKKKFIESFQEQFDRERQAAKK